MSFKYRKISVIMNCYNGEQFLKQSINSIINQTYDNWELIIWDNKSTDNSKKIILTFKDKRIKYFFSKKFNNLYKSRNLAIKKAQGEYICFLDTDDYWKKNFLEEMLKKIKIERCKIVFSKYLIKNEKKKKYSNIFPKNLPKIITTQLLLNKYIIGINAILIERNILRKYKFNDTYNIIGDFDLFIKLSTVYKIYILKKFLAIYRVHDLNYSKRVEEYFSEIKKWILINKKNLKKYNLNKIFLLMFKLYLKLNINKLFKLYFTT